MGLREVRPGLRTIHNGSNAVAKAYVVVPEAGELTVPDAVADQLLAATSAFKDGPAPQSHVEAVAERERAAAEVAAAEAAAVAASLAVEVKPVVVAEPVAAVAAVTAPADAPAPAKKATPKKAAAKKAAPVKKAAKKAK